MNFESFEIILLSDWLKRGLIPIVIAWFALFNFIIYLIHSIFVALIPFASMMELGISNFWFPVIGNCDSPFSSRTTSFSLYIYNALCGYRSQSHNDYDLLSFICCLFVGCDCRSNRYNIQARIRRGVDHAISSSSPIASCQSEVNDGLVWKSKKFFPTISFTRVLIHI